MGVTGAAGRLGGRLVAALRRSLPPERIVAIARIRQESTAALFKLGVPVRFADYDLPGQSTQAFRQGALYDDGRESSRLIGRPTTRWQQTVATVLRKPA